MWLAFGRSAQQVASLAAKLVKIGTAGKLGHSVSIAARGPRPGATRESCHKHGLLVTMEVDSVLPANPAAPSDAIRSLPADVAFAAGLARASGSRAAQQEHGAGADGDLVTGPELRSCGRCRRIVCVDLFAPRHTVAGLRICRLVLDIATSARRTWSPR
jgi:hypothetical protein